MRTAARLSSVVRYLLVWGRVSDPFAERKLGDLSATGPVASFSTLNPRGNPAPLRPP
jgi:hypothetical protein